MSAQEREGSARPGTIVLTLKHSGEHGLKNELESGTLSVNVRGPALHERAQVDRARGHIGRIGRRVKFTMVNMVA